MFAGAVPELKIWSVERTPPPRVKPAIWSPVASADAPMESRPAASPLTGSTAEPKRRTCPAVTVQTTRAEASAGRAKASKIDVPWTRYPPGQSYGYVARVTPPASTIESVPVDASVTRTPAIVCCAVSGDAKRKPVSPAPSATAPVTAFAA